MKNGFDESIKRRHILLDYIRFSFHSPTVHIITAYECDCCVVREILHEKRRIAYFKIYVCVSVSTAFFIFFIFLEYYIPMSDTPANP